MKKQARHSVIMYTIFAFFCFAGAFLLCFKTITETIKNGLSKNWESVQIVDIQEHIFTDYLPSKNRGYTIQTKYVYNIKYIIDGKLQDMTLTLFNTKLDPVDLRIEPHTRKIYVRRKLQIRDYAVRLFALFIAALIGLIFIQGIIKKLKKTNKQ